MDMLQFVMAVLVGGASVDLFTRAWKSFLRILAGLVLLQRGVLSSKRCRSRMHRDVLIGMLSSLCLLLLFRLYLVRFGLGRSPLEQMGYLAGVLPVMLHVLRRLPADIEKMFSEKNDN